MIDIPLTTEFAIAAGGVRWPEQIGSSGGLPRARWPVWCRCGCGCAARGGARRVLWAA